MGRVPGPRATVSHRAVSTPVLTLRYNSGQMGLLEGPQWGAASWGGRFRVKAMGSQAWLAGVSQAWRCPLPGQWGQIQPGRGCGQFPGGGAAFGLRTLPQPPTEPAQRSSGVWAGVCPEPRGWGQGALERTARPGPVAPRSRLSRDRGSVLPQCRSKGLIRRGLPSHGHPSAHPPRLLPWQCSRSLPALRDPPSHPSSGTAPEAFLAPWLPGLSPKSMTSPDPGLQLGYD